MRTSFLAAALATSALAAPLAKRASAINDYAILQYALTLEHLENVFYNQALSNYSESDFTAAGFDASVRENIVNVAGDEASHVAFLTSALSSLGQTPTMACTYAFGATDVKEFLTLASVIEGVGVSAYLGAAADIASKAYLTAAGSILTIEARHTAYIRSILGESPAPQPYDVPLDFDEVYSIASAFIVSCPSSNPTLPVKAFPALTAAPAGGNATATAGAQIKLSPASTAKYSGDVYAVWIGSPAVGNAVGVWNPATMSVMVPSTGFNGQVYVVLSSNMTVSDDTIIAGPAIVNISS